MSATTEQPIVNISGYKFIELADISELRVFFKAQCQEMGLKGTILLASEGINIALSGTYDQIQAFYKLLNQDDRFQAIFFKESFSEAVVFNRMLVKEKKFIIPFGEEIDLKQDPAPYLSPQELKKWYEEGRNFVMLDTRNDYEVRVGTFEKSIHLDLRHFRNLPEFTEQLEPYRDVEIVSFCTGGVRCEKAAPYLQKMGFKTYQLDGGILNYFQECGGAYYQGDCFVFDKRVALDADLQPTSVKQCYQCRMPLNEEEQQDFRYHYGTSCPYCYDQRLNKKVISKGKKDGKKGIESRVC